MSTSNDAIVAFGFNLEEERPNCLNIDQFDSYEKFDDMLVKTTLQEPQENFEYEMKNNSPQWEKYYKEAQEIKNKCPVELIIFCSYEYTMYFIALKNTEIRASRGSVKNVKMKDISEKEIQEFKNFCQKYDIKWVEPQWSLFGMNG